MAIEETTIKSIPKLKELPVLGSTLDFVRRPLDFLLHCRQQNHRLVRFTVVGRRLLLTTTPEDAKQVLQENNRNYVKSLAYDVLKIFLGNGLLTSEGDFWRRQRRLAQPAFHRQRLALLVDSMVEETADLVRQWQQHDKTRPMNISNEMMKLTLAIVTRSLFSSDVKSHLNNVSDSLDTIMHTAYQELFNIFPITRRLPVPRTVRFRRAVDRVESVIYAIIDQRRAATSAVEHQDLLAMLMEARDEETGEQMTNQQLRDEVTTIFMAGHETTANALSWALYLLAQHPDVVRKMRAEIAEVLGPNPVPTADNLRQLTYTLQVIQETMRLFPPAWVVSRRPLGPDQFGDYPVPVPGVDVVLVAPFLLHRDPRYWHNPEAFDPDHFLPDHVKERPTYAYLPFGGGPRICIGNNFALMEMQVVLVLLIHAFDVSLASATPVRPEPGITLRPKGGMQLRITVRAD